jgi:redox-sensitive bicupin YhaK (pirin superfamily)
MKNVLGVYSAPQAHWVGDGFPVRSIFSYQSHGKELSPFLLLDYAGPADFRPSSRPKGVGQHPHRGFETVTIVYEGEVAHRDSTGEGGVIKPGDVQWMTAGSGILHEEFHSETFARSGGTLEMVQLWVNLPARNKMTPPKYQAIRNDDIPAVPLADEAGIVRVIAGNYAGQAGPARTFTPLCVWDIRMNAPAKLDLPALEGWNTGIVVLNGNIVVGGGSKAAEAQMVLLDPNGEGVSIEASEQARMLLLSGEPIREPIVGRGPFVMNTPEEIDEAMYDFQSGTFGQIS